MAHIETAIMAKDTRSNIFFLVVPNFTLTVNGSVSSGNYKLAEGAAGFNKSITVVNTTGTILGTITVGASSTFDRAEYRLSLSNGTLSVQVQSFDNIELNGTTRTVSNGQVYSGTTVNSGGNLYISSGGVANNTTVNSNGRLTVSCGGTANGTTVNSYGRLLVSSGGVANSTTVSSGGSLYVSSAGTANSTTVSSGGSLYVLSGGTATDVVWTPCEGYVTSEYGAFVTFASQYSGVFYGSNGQLLSSAKVMESKTVSSAGSMYVMSGGMADNTTINSRGSMFVSSGGTANNTTVNSIGYLYVHSGGTANSTTVNVIGYLNVHSGGTANNTTVKSYGSMYVSSGGTATIVFNPWQGNIVSNYGAAITYLERNANVYWNESDGGVSKANAVKSLSLVSGRSAIIYSGGMVENTTVNSGGCLYVSSGGTATAIVENGGYVETAEGASTTFVSQPTRSVAAYRRKS